MLQGMEVSSGTKLPEVLLRLLNKEGDIINAATWASSNKGTVVAKLRNNRTKAGVQKHAQAWLACLILTTLYADEVGLPTSRRWVCHHI